jgi:hypothetical protein
LEAAAQSGDRRREADPDAPHGPLHDVPARPSIVVFICRDQANAKEFCRAADPVVTAAHAYGGELPGDWPYPARERMFFVAERDVHEGRLDGYALPALPPEVRDQQADGEGRAATARTG